MGDSSVVAVLILFACIGQMRAAVVLKIAPSDVVVERKVTSEKFKLHVTERSAKFDEEIEIDEENDIEYFKVPPHNEFSESDNLYDFKMNITVSRVNSDRVCHITPLPSDLPRPKVLSRGLKMLTSLPPSYNIEKTTQLWRLGDLVDKWTLRPEVREFCGEFPVYRLEPFSPDSVSVVAGDEEDTRAERTSRHVTYFPLCDNNIPLCHFKSWIFRCKIRTRRCGYYLTCRWDQGITCSPLTLHLCNGLVCCTATCS